jgi:hypothetical protein
MSALTEPLTSKEIAVLEPDSPWRRIVSLRYGAKAGVAAVVGSLALGGVAAAATGTMPGPLQDIAHFLGASSSVSAASESSEPQATESSSETADPSESESSATTGTPTSPVTGATTGTTTTTTTLVPTTGPDPLGPAAFGLCHAFGDKLWGHAASESAPPAPSGTTTGTTGGTATGTATSPTTTTTGTEGQGRKPDNPSVAYANLKAAADAQGLSVVAFCQVVIENHGVPSVWPTPDSTATSGTTTTGTTGTTPTTAVTTPGQGHGKGNGRGHAADRSHGHGRG